MNSYNYATDVENRKAFVTKGYAAVVPAENISTGVIENCEIDAVIDRVSFGIDDSHNGRPKFMLFGHIVGMTGSFPHNVSKIAFKNPEEKLVVINYDVTDDEFKQLIDKGFYDDGYDIRDMEQSFTNLFKQYAIKHPGISCKVLAVSGMTDEAGRPAPVIFAEPDCGAIIYSNSLISGYSLTDYVPALEQHNIVPIRDKNAILFDNSRPKVVMPEIKSNVFTTEMETPKVESKGLEILGADKETDIDFANDLFGTDIQMDKEKKSKDVTPEVKPEVAPEHVSVKDAADEIIAEEPVSEVVKEAKSAQEEQLKREAEEARLKREAENEALNRKAEEIAKQQELASKKPEELLDDAMVQAREQIGSDNIEAWVNEVLKEDVEASKETDERIATMAAGEAIADVANAEEFTSVGDEIAATSLDDLGDMYDASEIQVDASKTDEFNVLEEPRVNDGAFAEYQKKIDDIMQPNIGGDTVPVDVDAIEKAMDEKGVAEAVKKLPDTGDFMSDLFNSDDFKDVDTKPVKPIKEPVKPVKEPVRVNPVPGVDDNMFDAPDMDMFDLN